MPFGRAGGLRAGKLHVGRNGMGAAAGVAAGKSTGVGSRGGSGRRRADAGRVVLGVFAKPPPKPGVAGPPAFAGGVNPFFFCGPNRPPFAGAGPGGTRIIGPPPFWARRASLGQSPRG